jgi:hypothetical protein
MSTDRALSPTQQQVLGLILAGSTARVAAETAGVHRNTVANWLCSAEFRQALAYAQYEKAIFFREQAESLATDAHNAIRAMLADAAIPANVRLNAALAMIDRAGAAMPPPPPCTHPPRRTTLKCRRPPHRGAARGRQCRRQLQPSVGRRLRHSLPHHGTIIDIVAQRALRWPGLAGDLARLSRY